jgi:hypothetical protein
MGVAALAAALALGAGLLDALAAAGAGAALAAGTRALAGEEAAGLAAAVIAPLLAVASLADRGGSLAAPCLALAGIGWTVAELARPQPRSLLALALAPAVLAAIFAPAAAALIALAGARPTEGPRPRWALIAPVAGAIVFAVALIAGVSAHSGLGALWFGSAPRPIGPAALAGRVAEALGPIAVVAALGGLGALARPQPRPARNRWPELAVAACLLGALLADLRAGAVGPLTLGLGAVAAALGAARFGGQIRPSSGQALAAATVGLLLILPPAWTAAVGRRAPAHAPAPAPAAMAASGLAPTSAFASAAAAVPDTTEPRTAGASR